METVEITGSLGTVLVVDDEPGVRTALRLLLEPSYRVLIAEGGPQALEMLAGGSVDVMTLDLRMPGMDGLTTLRKIRQIDPDVQVVIMTGYASYETAVEGLRLHAFDYIEKPFETQRVMNVVRRATAARAARLRAARGEIDPGVAALLAGIDALGRPKGSRLDRTTRAQLEQLQLLACELADRLSDTPEEVLPDMIEQLDALAGRGDLFEEPALEQIREIARDLERRNVRH